MLVRDFMTPNPITFREEDNLRKAAGVFHDYKIDGAPVVDGQGSIIGIFTKTHLYRAIIQNLDGNTPISELMSRQVLTIEETGLTDVAWEMAWTFGVGRLPVLNADKKLVGMMARTDLVTAFERKYINTISQLNAILDSAHGGICAVDKNGIIITFNRTAEKLSGINRENALGRHIAEIVPHTELPQVLETGEAQYNQKLEINGVTVVANRTPIMSGQQVVGAVVVFQDLTELEAISKELSVVQELCQELDAVIDSSYDGIAVTDGRGNVLKVNQAYARLTGINVRAVLGKNTAELIKEGVISNSATLQALKEGKPVSIMQRTKDGRMLLVTGNPIFAENSNQITRVVVNCRDLTELNQLKRQLGEIEELKERYYSELEALRAQQLEVGPIVARSVEMKKIMELAARIALVDSNVLILGESGVGKEVVAKTIHKLSSRSGGPFIRINCGAIPENLLESELFGYEEGAFSGAKKTGKPGMFELAHGGTLFLDEVGDLPANLQVKLLSAIQEREVIRVGGTKGIKVDIRLIAATNKDLEAMVRRGTFRADLFYRLNVVPVLIPPLNQRKEDIIPLLLGFLDKFNTKYGLSKVLAPEVVDLFLGYSWPGNVRELENIVERLVVVTPGDIISPENLPGEMLRSPGFPALRQDSQSSGMEGDNRQNEESILRELYRRHRSTRKVAEVLGINQSTVVRRLRKYNIRLESI